jgi:prepilin-type N-terminal cleavage/methylation domain-containing protein/prepilin-type processing-associated H-X9-DG protein
MVTRRSNKDGAFTLIELLVVIALIAILASLLMPALGKAKARAQGAICVSNHQQLILAWHLYVEDNDGLLPQNDGGSIYVNSGPLNPGYHNWVLGSISWLPDRRDNTNTSIIVPGGSGSLGHYSKSHRIYKCPSDRSMALINGLPFPRVRSVMMNMYISDTASRPAYNAGVLDNALFYSTKDIRKISPANLFVLIDTHEDSVGEGAFAPGGLFGGYVMGDLPATRHGRSSPLSFADGHAEIRHWNQLTYKPVQRIHWFASTLADPVNPDPQWLYDHATYKLR